ncbi:MAG TPA: fasciclin domain-containing protein [Fimbriimonadaceae bacterium]|nr:fasciclin domain-containing protein [Fimbriimonadaceae bacterium]
MNRTWNRPLYAAFFAAMTALGVAGTWVGFTVLTKSDASCEELGGIPYGTEEVLIEVKKGIFKRVKFTKCSVYPEAQSLKTEQAVGGLKGLATFAAVLATSGLTPSLDSDGEFTLFVPQDSAFKGMPREDLARLTRDREAARGFVMRYLVKGHRVGLNLPAGKAGLKVGAAMTSGDGKVRRLTLDGERVALGDATIVVADLPVSNGVIHVIDKLQSGR